MSNENRKEPCIAKGPGEVQRELNRVNADLDSLNDQLGTLEGMVTMVLSDSKEQSTVAPTEVDPSAPLALELRRVSDRISSCKDRLYNISNRIEL